MISSQQDRHEVREQADAADHVVQRTHQLKRALEGQRRALEKAVGATDAEKMRRDVLDLIQQITRWEEALEAIRVGTAAVLAERDRWQVAHGKLRERIDRHALEPRTGDSAQPPPSRTARTAAAGSAQDYSVIDRELERLNESMLRALSSD